MFCGVSLLPFLYLIKAEYESKYSQNSSDRSLSLCTSLKHRTVQISGLTLTFNWLPVERLVVQINTLLIHSALICIDQRQMKSSKIHSNHSINHTTQKNKAEEEQLHKPESDCSAQEIDCKQWPWNYFHGKAFKKTNEFMFKAFFPQIHEDAFTVILQVMKSNLSVQYQSCTVVNIRFIYISCHDLKG